MTAPTRAGMTSHPTRTTEIQRKRTDNMTVRVQVEEQPKRILPFTLYSGMTREDVLLHVASALRVAPQHISLLEALPSMHRDEGEEQGPDLDGEDSDIFRHVDL